MDERGEPGWYPDPHHRFEFRYHNGERWTNDVAVHGQRLIDSGAAMTQPPTDMAWSGAPFESPRQGAAVASFVLAVAAAVIGWIPYVFVVAAVGVVLAVVFGVIGLRRSRERGGAGRGFATAGLVIAAAATCVCVVGMFFTVWFQRQIDRYQHPGQHSVQEGPCNATGGKVQFSGSLTNLESDTRSYELTVTFSVGGVQRDSQRVDVRSVAAGATAPWSTTDEIEMPGVSCAVAAVHGPAPLGIRPD